MTNRLVGITIDCANPQLLAAFWSEMLGVEETHEHENSGWSTVGSRRESQPRLTFQRVPEPKTGKTRIHLDIQVDDIDSGCHQVERLGGTWSGVRHDYAEGAVLIMLDPEGNEFCIVQYYNSESESPTT